METVILDGVEYVKASVAAKRFHYTSDYIGQLCRGKKIDARLVGRTWFVNPNTIEEHKQNKHKKNSSTLTETHSVNVTLSRDADIERETKPNRVQVLPTVTNKTAKALSINDNTGSVPNTRLAVQYESDEESLIPQITHKQTMKPHALPVYPAGAKQVKVRKRSVQHTSFTPEEIPSVALSGKINVSALEEPSEPDEPAVVKEAEEEHQAVIRPVKTLSRPKSRPQTPKITKTEVRKKLVVASEEPEMDTASQQSTQQTPTNSVQSSQATQQPQFSPRSVQIQQTVTPSLFMRFSPAFATVAAIVFMLMIFAASSQIISSDSENSSRVVFQMANLQAILSQ